MVWHRANRPQRYIKILKEVIIKALKLRISEILKLIIKGVEAKLKILAEEDI